MTPRYSVGTIDPETDRFTEQQGLTCESIDIPYKRLKQVLRELRSMGYSAHYKRDADGEHYDNDPSVLVERTDGMAKRQVLDGWKGIKGEV